MDFHSETLADRLVRLLGTNLRNPEKTREVLARLSTEAKEAPQLSKGELGELQQSQLFLPTM